MVQAPDVDEAVASDLPQALKLLSDMTQSVDQVTKLVDNMLVRVKNGEISTDMGLSFLEVKYHMLLSYLINLSFVALKKVSGKKIEGDPAIDRLVEIRTVLERIRPIDHKLKYQIDKLVKASVTGSIDSKDPSNFKANPANFASKLGDSDNGSSSDESDSEEKGVKEGEKTNVYVPPKLAAVHYDGDDNAQTRQEKQLERAKKRALQSSVMQELREEYMDTPIEVGESTSGLRVGIDKQQREREDYEEMYFTRLPVTKRDKQKSRRITTLGTLGDDLTRFEDISALEAGDGSTGGGKGKKRKQPKGKKKGFSRKKLKLH